MGMVEFANELNNLKKEFCGCKNLNNDDEDSETDLIRSSSLRKLFDDLNNDEIDIKRKENIIKLVAELAKNGKINFDTTTKYKGYSFII
jgi:hypothetical protein